VTDLEFITNFVKKNAKTLSHFGQVWVCCVCSERPNLAMLRIGDFGDSFGSSIEIHKHLHKKDKWVVYVKVQDNAYFDKEEPEFYDSLEIALRRGLSSLLRRVNTELSTDESDIHESLRAVRSDLKYNAAQQKKLANLKWKQ
jgi:hypothetical protein